MSVLSTSFVKQIKASRGLYRALKPIADKYANFAGYRQHGLKYDDIIIEENAVVAKALTRLTERESYDRAFRHRVAHAASVAHDNAPKDRQVKPEDDTRYLVDIIGEIEAENAERKLYDSAKVERKH